MKAAAAYDRGLTGRGVTIAIVDTGIAQRNSEFSGRISADSKAMENRIARCMTCAPETLTFDLEDQAGHGTETASVAAGARDGRGIHGVAPEATILAIKVVAPDMNDLVEGVAIKEASGINTAAIAPAVGHAIDKGAFVVSMSLNGTASGMAYGEMRSAMDKVRSADRLVVQSVSNSIGDRSFTGQIAEAMVGIDLANRDWFLFGIRVDAKLRAPEGGNGLPEILADRTLAVVADNVGVVTKDGTVTTTSGNSFAAPAIAGAAALLKEHWPQLGGRAIARILLDTARDLGAPGADQIFGVGLLDMENALTAQAPAASFAAAQVVLGRLSSLTLSAPFGGAAGAAALDRQVGGMTVIDRYGRDYRMTASMGIRARGSGLLAAGMMVPIDPPWMNALRDVRFGFAPSTVGPWQGTGSNRPAIFAFSPTSGQSVTLGANVAVGQQGGIAGSPLRAIIAPPVGISSAWTAGGWSASFASGSARNGRASLRVTSLSTPLGVGLAMSALTERGQALGLTSGPELGTGGGRTRLMTVTARRQILGLGVTARATAATTRIAGGSEMLRFADPVAGTAFSFEAARPMRSGLLTVGISSPLRVERARATMVVPIQYDLMSGSLTSRLEMIDLTPMAREIDLELGWSSALSATSSLRIGVAHALAAGHVAGARDTAGFVALVLR